MNSSVKEKERHEESVEGINAQRQAQNDTYGVQSYN
jgi:hypothetical protein